MTEINNTLYIDARNIETVNIHDGCGLYRGKWYRG